MNLGTGKPSTISDIGRILADGLGVEATGDVVGTYRAGDIRHCYADIGKARDLLGFAPKLHLENALDPFVEWVAGQDYRDRGPEMRRQLEARGLVS